MQVLRRPAFKIFSLLAFLSFSACLGRLPKDPTWLTTNLGNEPPTLNPIVSSDAYAGEIEAYIFESLIDRDRTTLEFIPKLATSWEISKDLLTYTFHLRTDVKWHDGSPFSADDVIYSFERIRDPKVDAPNLRSYYKDISKLEKLNDTTIRFTYATPYYKAFEICGGMPIVAKNVFENAGDFNKNPSKRHPIGTGPYRFVLWETGKRIVLERNEAYWDKNKLPEIRGLNFRIITDSAVALQELKKGELDLESLQPIQWVKQTTSDQFQRDFVRHEYYQQMYRYIGWNLRRPVFQDVRVRKALTLLVNRPAVLEKLEFGFGKLVSGPYFFQSDDANPDVLPDPYDPAEAKRLLFEAGWDDHDGDGILDKDGTPFRFTLLIRAGNLFYDRLATIIKEDFRQAGIDAHIESLEWGTFLQRVKSKEHDFDAAALGWSMGFDSDQYPIWHSSEQTGNNFVGYANPEVDKLLVEARKTFDRKKRAEINRRIHALIHDDYPYTFLFTPSALVARSARFKNVTVYRGGLDVLEWKL